MIETAWEDVARAADRLRDLTLSKMFDRDPGRFEALSFREDDLLIDLSKEKLDRSALDALLALARAAGVEARREAMFRGEKVNETEGRAALHMALRGGTGARVTVDGQEVMPGVEATLARFLALADDLRAGRVGTVSGAPFSDVVNIGIGGSDLGPSMATRALAPWADGPRMHFVSNVDGAHLADTVRHLDPARTLVIIASKSFTTLETITNARSARNWLAGALGSDTGAHLAAVSSNNEATRAFGIDETRTFDLPDWAGGRFSLWSAIGLPLAIAIGSKHFHELLAGARAMDRHFCEAPLAGNLPVLLALAGIWRRNAMGWPTAAIVPYDQRLALFPGFLQQLEMESNGKRTRLDGAPVSRPTAPVIWGGAGTNAQHSFFQLLHQGTDIVPVDFLLAARPDPVPDDHHAKLVASALAQSAALAFGRSEEAVRAEMRANGRGKAEIDRLAPHRAFPGDRPSTTILYRRLGPFTLGRLIALHEHKVFVQGVIWGIDSFDQWGVELGKQLAESVLPALGGDTDGLDNSTAGLIGALRMLREENC